MVLLFTNKEDVHPTAVIPLIEAKGQEVFRLNTEALLTDYEFEWVFDGKSTDFQIRNIQNGLCINGSNVTCIWDRRPEEPSELPVKGNSNVDKHNLEEAGGFLYWLRYYLKNIPSIGSITADRITGSKMLQIKIANEVGFKIPATVFSNRKAAIESLTCRNEHIALKSIENPYIFDEETEQEYVFYTQLVGSSLVKEAPEEAFSQTVTFAQSYVPKDYEVRVTVVGESIFACRINSQEEQSVGKKDWRKRSWKI